MPGPGRTPVSPSPAPVRPTASSSSSGPAVQRSVAVSPPMPAPLPPLPGLSGTPQPQPLRGADFAGPPAGPSAAPLSVGPVRRGIDGLPLTGIAAGLPTVQRAPAVPAPTPIRTPGPAQAPTAQPPRPGQGRGGQAVPLTSVRPAPAAALPVQRAPSTPSVPPQLRKSGFLPSLMERLTSAPRAAEPRVTTVSVGGSNAGGGRPPGALPSNSTPPAGNPPAYSAIDPHPRARGGSGFDARTLSDGQVDELTHRLIGPITRLLRTELRLDRERIGRLRDTRR